MADVGNEALRAASQRSLCYSRTADEDLVQYVSSHDVSAAGEAYGPGMNAYLESMDTCMDGVCEGQLSFRALKGTGIQTFEVTAYCYTSMIEITRSRLPYARPEKYYLVHSNSMIYLMGIFDRKPGSVCSELGRSLELISDC